MIERSPDLTPLYGVSLDPLVAILGCGSKDLILIRLVIKVNLNIEHCTPTSTESAKKGHRYFVISSMLKLNYIANMRPGEQDGPYTSLFSYLLINIAVRPF